MKSIFHITVFLCIFSLLYGVAIIKVYTNDKHKLKQWIEPSFIFAVKEELKMRFDLNGAYYHYTYDPVKSDSIQSMYSIMDEQFHMLHTVLREEYPINTNTIDSLFSKHLIENGCTGETGVEYIDHSLNVIQKSGDISLSNLSGDNTRVIPIGFYSEMSLQGFVLLSPLSVILSAKEHYFLLCVVYLLVLLLAISLINVRFKKKPVDILKKRIILFNSQKKILENDERGEQVSLTTQQTLLLGYLLNSEDHYISNDQMREVLWDSKDFIGTSRQYQSIDRLRKKLESIPEIRIVNEHGQGYSLIIDDTVEVRYSTPHTSPQSDLHTSPR